MAKLFDDVIMSISFNQHEIINNIIDLYIPSGRIDVDPTFSKGVFYKGVVPPRYKFDLNPQTKDTVKADYRFLPLEDESVNSIMFDPPFVIGGDYKTCKGSDDPKSSIISKRFDSFRSFDELKNNYFDALKEFYRILEPNGILIFKCQDVVASKKQYLSHVYIISKALEIGYYPKDIFILLAKSRVLNMNHGQEHARKFHSYFLVFIKQKCPVDYS